MFCTKCGLSLRETDKYCSECGSSTGKFSFGSDSGTPRLARSLHDRKIAGVCAGVARYLHLDPTVIRVIAIILLFWPVPLVATLAYVILWMVMPQDPLGLPAVPRAAQLTALR